MIESPDFVQYARLFAECVGWAAIVLFLTTAVVLFAAEADRRAADAERMRYDD